MRFLVLCHLVLFMLVSPVFAVDETNEVESLAITNVDSYTYEPQNKRDPFTPLVQDTPEEVEVVSDTRPEELKGPLEQYELSQLRLMAIVVIKGVPNAMVTTPDGKSYRVEVGDFIGQKNGQVKNIETKAMAVDDTGQNVEKNPDRIVVVETTVNKYTGNKVTETRYIEL